MSKSSKFELITMNEMAQRKSGSYFIPDELVIGLSMEERNRIESALSDLMEENQDLMLFQYYDTLRNGTALEWRPKSEFN